MGDFKNMIRALKETRRLDRERKGQWLIDVAITVGGLIAGGLVLWTLLWLTRQ